MKKAIRSLVILAALGSAVQAAPFLAMGDSAELFLTGTLGVRADDNILLGANKTSDTIFDIVPGIEVVYGQNALTKGTAFYKENFTRYSSNSKLNKNLSSVGYNGTYDDQKMKINFKASYDQLAQNTVDVRAGFLVRRDVTDVAGGSEIAVTDKSKVAGSVDFNRTNYKRTGFVDVDSTTIPLNYYYEISPKLDMSAGFQFRNNSVGTGGSNSKDYFYNVGARGEFTPKLKGMFAIGVTERHIDNGGTKTTPGIQSGLTYAVDEKTSVSFGVTNDYGYSGAGQSERNLTYNVGAQSRIADDWTVGGNLSYRSINYIGAGSRTDDYLEGSLNATYVLNSMVNFTGGYTYRKLTSDLRPIEFNNSVFAIAANVRY
jgi:polysaccharide biosynthesis protein VpsM